MKKRKSLYAGLAGAFFVLVLAFGALAQDQGPVFTRVANWQIARTSWDAYAADYKKNTVPVMEKLLADGVIIEYGADENNVHTPDGYTHGTWFVSRTMAGLEKALDALVESGRKLSPEERKRQDTEFAGTKHADIFLRSVLYRTKPGRLDRGYGVVSSVRVHRGKAQEYRALFDKHSKPVYEELLANGTVVGYGMDIQQFITEAPGMHNVWYIVPNAEGLDKVRAAFSARSQKRSEEENRAITSAFIDATVDGSLNHYMGRVISWAAK